MTGAEMLAIRRGLGLSSVKFGQRLGLNCIGPKQFYRMIRKMESGRKLISERVAARALELSANPGQLPSTTDRPFGAPL